MATVTIEIGKLNSKGLRPVTFLICHEAKKRRIPSGVYVSPSELTKKGRIKNSNKLHALERKRISYTEKLETLFLNNIGAKLTIDTIYSALTAKDIESDFIGYALSWIDRQDNRSVPGYKTAINSLRRYIQKDTLSFREMNYAFLQGYAEYLRPYRRAPNAYLGCIKHIFQAAVKELNTEYVKVIDFNPFETFGVPRQKMNKGVRALSLEDLLRIFNYKTDNKRTSLTRDAFLLSFGLMGMNAIDMMSATTFRDPYICYCRTKTAARRNDNAYIEVRVHERLRPLFDRYRGKETVFCFSESYRSPATFNSLLYHNMRKIAKDLGIDNLQFYQARHTFATLSRNMMKFAKSDVDEALNHVGSYDIADVYIKKDFTIINENNMKLLDRIFGMLDEQLGHRYEF